MYYFYYIIYIVYSFLILFGIYLCILIYQKYSFSLYDNVENIITSEKLFSKNYECGKKNKINKKNINLENNKIEKLKKKFKIKSTEKTYEEIKFISNKPNYINLNIITNANNINNDIICEIKKIKDYQKNELTKKITNIYIETKQIFFNYFVNNENGKYFINDLNDFCLFHKSNMDKNYNILIKFYFKNKSEYLYIFVNKNKMIKITYNDDYDNICELIEKNNGPFMMQEYDKNSHYICYGSFISCDNSNEKLKNLFFTNVSNYVADKNFQLMSKYEFIKIYFYICNEII